MIFNLLYFLKKKRLVLNLPLFMMYKIIYLLEKFMLITFLIL